VAGGYAFDRVIAISGELEKGDADKFRTAISGSDHLLVELNGPGGLLEEGLIIGKEIRAGHFATGVAPDWRCSSACAFAWLAGKPRIAARSATILFHHPWNDEGTPDLDAAVNAILGAYLGSLGLSESAIFFMTEKGKDEGNLLTEEIAQVYGIETVFVGKAAPIGVERSGLLCEGTHTDASFNLSVTRAHGSRYSENASQSVPPIGGWSGERGARRRALIGNLPADNHEAFEKRREQCVTLESVSRGSGAVVDLIQPALNPGDHLVVQRHRSMAGVHQLVEVDVGARDAIHNHLRRKEVYVRAAARRRFRRAALSIMPKPPSGLLLGVCDEPLRDMLGANLSHAAPPNCHVLRPRPGMPGPD
jgi:hypothetical protein